MIRSLACAMTAVTLTATLGGGATVQAAPQSVSMENGGNTGGEAELRIRTLKHWPFAEPVKVTVYSPKLKTRLKGYCIIYVSDYEIPASGPSSSRIPLVNGTASTSFKVYEPGMFFTGAVCSVKGFKYSQVSDHFRFDVS